MPVLISPLRLVVFSSDTQTVIAFILYSSLKTKLHLTVKMFGLYLNKPHLFTILCLCSLIILYVLPHFVNKIIDWNLSHGHIYIHERLSVLASLCCNILRTIMLTIYVSGVMSSDIHPVLFPVIHCLRPSRCDTDHCSTWRINAPLQQETLKRQLCIKYVRVENHTSCR